MNPFENATTYLYQRRLMGPGYTCGKVWYELFRDEAHVETLERLPFEPMLLATASMVWVH